MRMKFLQASYSIKVEAQKKKKKNYANPLLYVRYPKLYLQPTLTFCNF